MKQRKLVILNQFANYLTVDLANAFAEKFDSVTLIVGTLYAPKETLGANVKVKWINAWHDRPAWKKVFSQIFALFRMWMLLIFRYPRHEVLFISAPPMGYLLNLILPHQFSMIIWDLYPDTLKIKGMLESHPVYRVWAWLNRRSFRKAFKIFSIGEVLADAIAVYVDRSSLIVHPIWSVFTYNQRIPPSKNLFLKQNSLDGKFIVQYSGNIGLTHNVERLIEVAERMKDDPGIVFQIIGRGPRLPAVEKLVREKKLDNIQLLPYQSDEMFPHSLSAANLGVVILDGKVSRGSVPSKVYNLMSFGIPALYISDQGSELAKYAEKFGNARCFSADQLSEMADFISELSRQPEHHQQMSLRAKKAAQNFSRENVWQFVHSYHLSK